MRCMTRPRVRIVTPALAAANNGNWHTAERWQGFLSPTADTDIALDWDGEPVDALIALHARRSAESIEQFHRAYAERPLALVLTGTDLYRDLDTDLKAQHSVEFASHLVVLQQEALKHLSESVRAKARCIVQSASQWAAKDTVEACDFIAVGHLRSEKDPVTLMDAARLLPPDSTITIVHIGAPLDDALAAHARLTMADCARYRWLGGLAATPTRDRIASARALIHMSRLEGGANVVIEAIRSKVPVLASRIDGNVGLLGPNYDGYFPVGNAAALAALMQRFMREPTFAATLAAQCAAREPLFSPECESAAVNGLLLDMLQGSPQTMQTTVSKDNTP